MQDVGLVTGDAIGYVNAQSDQLVSGGYDPGGHLGSECRLGGWIEGGNSPEWEGERHWEGEKWYLQERTWGKPLHLTMLND